MLRHRQREGGRASARRLRSAASAPPPPRPPPPERQRASLLQERQRQAGSAYRLAQEGDLTGKVLWSSENFTTPYPSSQPANVCFIIEGDRSS